LPFLGQSARPRSVNVASLRTLNCYAEVTESRQGKTLAGIYGSPGLAVFGTLSGLGGVRGLYLASTGRLFAVQGSSYYEVLSDGTSTLYGTILSSSGPVSMADNGQSLVLVDGSSNGWYFTLATNTFAQISSPDFFGGDTVQFLDTYMVLNKPGTQQFYWTDLQSVTFDALNFASAEGAPDRLVTLMTIHRELWLMGAASTEIWVDTGNLDSPFQRLQGAFVQHGCVAAHSVARLAEQLYWLGANDEGQGVVYRNQGYLPEPISTHPVAFAMQGYGTISDAIAYTYEQEHHAWYIITFPSANATWAYDAVTGLWSERAYLDPTTGLLGRHRSNCHALAFGKHLVGDFENGTLYQLDLNTYSDNGAALPMEVIFPPLFDGQSLARMRHNRLQLDLEVGVGLDGGVVPGTDPQVMMQMSNDAHTWGAEHWRSAGKIGEYQTRVQWHRLGQARDRRYKITITDPVKRAIVAGYIDAEGGTS